MALLPFQLSGLVLSAVDKPNINPLSEPQTLTPNGRRCLVLPLVGPAHIKMAGSESPVGYWLTRLSLVV